VRVDVAGLTTGVRAAPDSDGLGDDDTDAVGEAVGLPDPELGLGLGLGLGLADAVLGVVAVDWDEFVAS